MSLRLMAQGIEINESKRYKLVFLESKGSGFQFSFPSIQILGKRSTAKIEASSF
jgi:hypothetical protein